MRERWQKLNRALAPRRVQEAQLIELVDSYFDLIALAYYDRTHIDPGQTYVHLAERVRWAIRVDLLSEDDAEAAKASVRIRSAVLTEQPFSVPMRDIRRHREYLFELVEQVRGRQRAWLAAHPTARPDNVYPLRPPTSG